MRSLVIPHRATIIVSGDDMRMIDAFNSGMYMTQCCIRLSLMRCGQARRIYNERAESPGEAIGITKILNDEQTTAGCDPSGDCLVDVGGSHERCICRAQ
jgi:hypothetical protein